MKQKLYPDQQPKNVYNATPDQDYLKYLEDAVAHNYKVFLSRTTTERNLAITITITIVIGTILYISEEMAL